MRSTQFSRISSIDPDIPDTYDRVFLTFDIDWAHDEVVHSAIDMVEKAGVEATWFITHASPIVNRLRGNPLFEIGIHPNFNFLLDGDKRNGGDIREVIDRLMNVCPEAKSLRSHSLSSSTKLLQLMPEYGLTHESNLYVPFSAGVTKSSLVPFKLWNGVIRVPHIFEDDLHMLEGGGEKRSFNGRIMECLSLKGAKVFDFHPIHVFLNSECFERYDSSRNVHHQPEELKLLRYFGEGTRRALTTLLEQGNACSDYRKN